MSRSATSRLRNMDTPATSGDAQVVHVTARESSG